MPLLHSYIYYIKGTYNSKSARKAYSMQSSPLPVTPGPTPKKEKMKT